MSKPVRLTYVGLRLNGKYQAIQCFIDPDGKEMYWRGLKYLVIGGVYTSDDGKMKTSPDKIDSVEVKDEWLDQDTATREKLASKREGKKASNLADRYWNMRICDAHKRCEQLSIFEQQAFAYAIARMIMRGKK